MTYTRRRLKRYTASDIEEKRNLAKTLVGKRAKINGLLRPIVDIHEPTGEAVVRVGRRNEMYDPRSLEIVA